MSCGFLRSRKNIYVPRTDRSIFVESPIPVFLVEHAKGNVLFDTGPHPDVFENATERWGGLAKAIEPIGNHKSDVISQLKTIGVTPQNIRYVVNSHLHCDHAGGNQFFTDSIFLVQSKEIECATNPEHEEKGYIRADWDHPLKYQEVEGELDIYGDGSLILIPMPGHTWGHQILLVRLRQHGTVILSGDCVPCIENYIQVKTSRTNIDDTEALRSIKKLHKLVEEKSALLIHGHDPIQWKQIPKVPEYYE